MNDPSHQRLGDFEIVCEIGRGGMGVVYEARQVSLNRKVAIKVLSGSLGLTPKAVERFRREALAAGKLHHTNIVPVYTTGEHAGTHFYAMELIEGPSLDHVIRQARRVHDGRTISTASGAVDDQAATGPYVASSSTSDSGAGALTSSSFGSDSHYFDTVARMMAEVADALDYAHKQGVVHRDVKPSNFLLSADGRMSINDFGLARMLEQPGMTMTGEFVGTPRYMSPEQIAAGRTPLDHRTDIYSLGATLYELLTLQPPFLGEARDQVLAQIMHKDPKPPRKLNKKVPVDLETICLKALEKDPDRRYQTAGALAEDLRRFVQRFAIAARRTGPIGRSVKWIRRRPAMAAAISVALLGFLCAVFFAIQVRVAQHQHLLETQEAEERLLAEQRQNALDKALLIAMSGDLDEAEKATQESERWGASTGQVRMLRAVVAYHRGENEEAIRHLEQAVALLPDSVAVQAMLSAAYWQAGEPESSSKALEKMKRLEPKTPEDYLYKGYVISQWDPTQGLRILEESSHRHPSLLARVLTAEARAWQALDSSDVVSAEKALADIRAVKEILSENPVVLCESMIVNMAASAAYEQRGDAKKSQQALNNAESDARDLERFSTLPFVLSWRWTYYFLTDRIDEVIDQLCRVGERTNNTVTKYYCGLGLWRRGEIVKAIGVLESRRGTDVIDLLRTYLVAESAAGPSMSLAAHKEYKTKHSSGMHSLYGYGVLRWLGRREEALASCRTDRKSILPEDSETSTFDVKGLDYNCGLLSEGDLLNSASGSQYRKCMAHFWIALDKLAIGNRVAARDHLRECAGTKCIALTAWDLSKVWLFRMEQDPTWPPWIPIKN